jgi:hypothetical protein
VKKVLFVISMLSIIGLADLSAQCNTCTITFTGSGSNFNLNGNETLCIQSGTFTGTVNFNGSGNRVCIAAGATFRPNSLNNVNAVTINNYGTFEVRNAFSLGAGTVINNYKNVIQTANFNFNGAVTMYNALDAVWTTVPNFVLQNQSRFTNDGHFHATAEISTNSGTQFTNNGRVLVGTNFNPGGQFSNYGFLRAFSFININANAVFRNYCTMYSDEGYNNNSGSTQNFGLIWVTSNNALIQNNAPYFQGPDALLRAERFENNSSVTGSGSYYFTKNTRNQGPFGQDGLGINFYDVSGNAGSIFDVENTKPHPSVTRIPFTPKDTTYVFGGCATIFVAPVAMDTAFIANVNEPVLIDIALITIDTVFTINYQETDINPATPETDSVYVSPGRGAFSLQPNGKVQFVPEQNFTGRVVLNYTVINEQGFRSNVGTVELVVENTSPLPVELIFFNAIAQENNTMLTWSTASEFNSDYFEVQRSRDGINFESISRTDAAGYSAARLDYAFTDASPFEGENYYRLKQVDFDGTTEFFRIVNVFFGEKIASPIMKAYPNPVQGRLRVESSQPVETILVMDLSGKVVYSDVSREDVLIYDIDLSAFNSGLYLVQVRSGSSVSTLKIVKQ